MKVVDKISPESVKKADLLATEMQKMLVGEAKISRPNVMREIKLTGLDESISVDEVREAIASNGLCKLEEINVGRIGRTRSGNGIVWAKCPKTSAVTLAEKKKIQID